MARNTKKIKKEKKPSEQKDLDQPGILSTISEETLDTISSVIFILISILMMLAAFGQAGRIGEITFNFLTKLFGIGYFLAPLILVGLGISFIAQKRHNLAVPKILGACLFFLSGLGLVNLVFTRGGIVGNLISSPLLSLFDFWASLLFLLALLAISLLVVFEASLKVSKIREIISKINGTKDAVQDVDADVEPKIKNNTEENTEQENQKDKDVEPKIATPPQDDKNQQNKKPSGLVFFSKTSSRNIEFSPPPLSLLEKDSGKPGVGDIKANTNIIKRTLNNFGIQVEMDEVSIGPSVTRYALKPAEGVKLSRIVALQNDLALALAAHPLRIEAPIPGKSLVGIEVPNTEKTLVGLGSLLKSPDYANSPKALLTCLGKGITGLPNFADLAKMPHLLIAGSTGSGKSVTIHALVTSLLFRNHPDNLKFIMIDPKRVELTLYNKIPHLLTPVITDPKKAILALKWAAQEMNRRYDLLEQNSVRDIGSYHQNIYKPAIENKAEEIPENMPYIVIIIDELADIMQTYPRELEAGIVRLAQMSRAVGIHLMISTQRPSVNVITGLIKANIPARLALQVASQIDSRTILDMPGAEKLLGAGDMLFLSGEMSQPRRIQSAFISEKEVKNVVDWLINNYAGQPEVDSLNLNTEQKNDVSPIFDSLNDDKDSGDDDDDLYNEAKQIVISAGKASTSYIQRRLRVGYSRAARLIDMLEERGVVGPADGSKPREVVGGAQKDSSEIENSDLDKHEE